MEKNKVVISVSGGNVNGVFISNPKITVYLVDYDNLETNPSDECSKIFPTQKIEEFHSIAREAARFFPSITKLLTRLLE